MTEVSPPAPRRRKCAVVIEDDADLRELHERTLIHAGYEPILTANGEDGVEAVRQHNPLVTIVDVTMAGMDGFDATRRIREFSDTYILMVTALSDDYDVVEGLTAGADDYLTKPFSPREMRARIDALTRRPRHRSDDPLET